MATFDGNRRTDPDGGTSDEDGDPASTLKLTAEGDRRWSLLLTNTGEHCRLTAAQPAPHTISCSRQSPNYESPADADGNNKYHVTIVTTDNEGASSSLPLVITVMNVDEDLARSPCRHASRRSGSLSRPRSQTQT